MDEHTISPAGDPFYAASLGYRRTDAQDSCGCYGGFVYIGHMVEAGDGEEVEVFEAARCRRCSDSR